jgi:hypothetical protein
MPGFAPVEIFLDHDRNTRNARSIFFTHHAPPSITAKKDLPSIARLN